MPKVAEKRKGVTAKSGGAGTSRTVTLKQMAAELAERHDLAKKQTEAVLSDLVILATRHLKKGERLRLSGFGILQIRHRAARMGRNPATGEP
jgi:DNA-binding protein HU-beta